MYNKKLNKQNEARNTINDDLISNLITLINSFVFTK